MRGVPVLGLQAESIDHHKRTKQNKNDAKPRKIECHFLFFISLPFCQSERGEL